MTKASLHPRELGFKVPQNCSICHRIDRLDLSGDPQAPARVPIRAFFQMLPMRVPQIHLGPEYYDHMAFTELTEANAKLKDSVFGVYGSLLLSELASRKRLATLTANDKHRYERLRPYYPELLTPLSRVDSLTNSIEMRLLRIPTPEHRITIGSLTSDAEHQPDEYSHPLPGQKGFFMAMYKVTNAEFRRFHPNHHVPPYRGLDLDGDDQPAVDISYQDAQAFCDWLNRQPAELNGRPNLPASHGGGMGICGARRRWTPLPMGRSMAATRGLRQFRRRGQRQAIAVGTSAGVSRPLPRDVSGWQVFSESLLPV